MPRLPPVTSTLLPASPHPDRFMLPQPEMQNPPSTTSVWPVIIARFGQAQQIHRAGDVVGRQRRAERRALREVRQQLLAIREVAQRVGVDHAGAHRVDADSARAELLRQRAHQRLQRRLGGADEAVARASRAQRPGSTAR